MRSVSELNYDINEGCCFFRGRDPSGCIILYINIDISKNIILILIIKISFARIVLMHFKFIGVSTELCACRNAVSCPLRAVK